MKVCLARGKRLVRGSARRRAVTIFCLQLFR